MMSPRGRRRHRLALIMQKHNVDCGDGIKRKFVFWRNRKGSFALFAGFGSILPVGINLGDVYPKATVCLRRIGYPIFEFLHNYVRMSTAAFPIHFELTEPIQIQHLC